MRLRFVTLPCLLVIMVSLSTTANAQEFIGFVKSIEGGATIQRNHETVPVTAGLALCKGDLVRTGGNGYVGLVFSDDTRVTMGPGTEIAVDDYRFKPLEKDLSFVLRMVRGTVSFLSGQLPALSPESVRLVMPAATIGVRGTHVLLKVD